MGKVGAGAGAMVVLGPAWQVGILGKCEEYKSRRAGDCRSRAGEEEALVGNKIKPRCVMTDRTMPKSNFNFLKRSFAAVR
jgi:hypothetical protein